MTEISKIKINNNNLIIKDSQAREDIDNLYNINADNFSSINSYQIGDYVLYNGSLYRFISSHNSDEWNPNHVIGVNLSSEIQQKLTDAPNDGNIYARKNNNWMTISGESGGSGGIGLGDTITFEEDTAVITIGERKIDELYNMNSDYFSAGATYNIGDYTINEGKLYKFISDHNQLPWDISHVKKVNITDELKLKADFAKEILYFGTNNNNAMTINVGINQIIGTITNSLITSNMVLLNCTFANPSYITSDIQWETNNGYITLLGTCIAETSADIILGLKGN